MANFISGKNRMRLACATVAIVAGFAPAHAQQEAGFNGLDEIVVTAQRRSENLQSVPISVTALSADTLTSGGVNSSGALPQMVPSVQLVRSGPSAMFFVRGVGNTSGGTGEEGANAIYVDGVYMVALSQMAFDFNNIERIEVLKGPQGTLFGRNASGGLINVITRDPTEELTVKGQVGLDNFQTYSGQLYVSGALTNNLKADIAFVGRTQEDGWGKNRLTGEDRAKGWSWGVRSKLLWEPNDTTRVVLAGDYSKQKDDYAQSYRIADGAVGVGGVLPVQDWDNASDAPADNRQTNWGVSLTADFDMDWATLSSITAVRTNESDGYLDGDGGPNPLLRIHVPSEAQSFQQEIRLASNDTEPFSWQVGLFYLRSVANLMGQRQQGTMLYSATDSTSLLDSGSAVYSKMKTHSIAGFGEVTWAITPTTHITGGLRFTQEDRDLTARGEALNYVVGSARYNAATFAEFSDTLSYNTFTYRAAIRQDLTDNVNIYASYNRGFKAGLWGMGSPKQPPVKPQYTDAYEVGIKSELFDRRLRLNLSGFIYDINDYQVRSAANEANLPMLLNAATVKIKGIEGEFEVAPTQGLRIFGNAAYLDSTFSSFPGSTFTYPNPANCASGVTGKPTGGNLTCYLDVSGNQTPLAPKFAGNIGINYSTNFSDGSELLFTANYSYNDGYYFEPDNRLRQEAFSVVNGSVEYRPTDRLGFELFARNLLNEKYSQQKLAGGPGDIQVLAAPRTWGVNVRFSY